jgi:hypothetical protein
VLPFAEPAGARSSRRDEPLDVVLVEPDVLPSRNLDPRQDAIASEPPDVPLGVAEPLYHLGSSEKS